jgi:glutamyl-tRNA reductase
VREKLVFDGEQSQRAVGEFRRQFPDGEIVLLSTCNRVEIYTTTPTNGAAVDDKEWAAMVSGLWGDWRGVKVAEFSSALYHKTGAEAVGHLFAVAASMDSMVLGETQILGQVRQAYEASRALGAAGGTLHPLFQRAVAVGKEVHGQTALGEGRLSVASVAVDCARRIFDTFTDKTVLCIGAGKMSTLLLQRLSALQPRKLIVCNRDKTKAQALAERFGGEAAELEKLADLLVAADIVVSGTGSAKPLVTQSLFEGVMRRRRYRPVFIIDIALPRDVEPSVGEADNVYLYNLDDLQQAVAATSQQRRGALEAAEKIVAEHVRQFLLAQRTREMGPAIDRLYRRYHTMAQEELARTVAKLPGIGEQEKAQLEECVRRLVNKVLHDPVRKLRQSDAAHAPAAQYLHALEMLFQLKDEEPPGEGDDKVTKAKPILSDP